MAPPILFFAFAAHDLRNIPEETRQIVAALEPCRRQGMVEVRSHPDVLVDQVLDALQDPWIKERLVIFHFAGHADAASLLLQTATATPVPAHGDGLARLLGSQPRLLLAFFNGCSTQGHLERLRAAGVPAAIVTSAAINDAVATELSSRFYRAIAARVSIPQAFEQAQAAVLTRYGKTRSLLYRSFVPEAESKDLPWQLWIDPAHMERVAAWRLQEGRGQETEQPEEERERSWWSRFGRPLRQSPAPPSAALWGALLAAIAAVPSLLFGLGLLVLRSRESLLGLSEPLDYPAREAILVGLSGLMELVRATAFVVFTGEGWVRGGAWLGIGLLVLTAVAGRALVPSRRRGGRVVVRVVLALSWLTLLFGIRFYIAALFPPHADVAPGPSFAVGPGGSRIESVAFETVSWLKNDDPRNEDRRIALAGVAGWLLLVSGFCAWQCFHSRALVKPWRGLATVAFLALSAITVTVSPRAYAAARWGLSYPRLVVDAACAPDLAAAIAPAGCCLFDVSARGLPRTTLLWGHACAIPQGFRTWVDEKAGCFVTQGQRVIDDDC